jgi:hypothetical protein
MLSSPAGAKCRLCPKYGGFSEAQNFMMTPFSSATFSALFLSVVWAFHSLPIRENAAMTV